MATGPSAVQGMYEAAAGLPGRGGTEGRHWYPHACLFYFHKYRGDLIVDVLEALGPGRCGYPGTRAAAAPDEGPPPPLPLLCAFLASAL